jgi:sterol desaturase/sphingolipid hydroxylase (fatty acid hydroxylase superfamily)
LLDATPILPAAAATYESLARIAAFLVIFALMATWEVLAPRREPQVTRSHRWKHNIALLLIDVATIRIVVPGAALGVALAAEVNGWGLLNALALPDWLGVLVAIAFLDLAIYFQHVTFHAVPALWRLHRVHHADLEFDVTTGTRFHPLEILISTGVKCAAVAAIGAPAFAVLAFEILLNGTAIFNHANVRIDSGFDRWLRWIVVTPDMHRVHHSINYNESSSNFGFNLPWWDRMFGTYRDQPGAGHDRIVIGVDAFRTLEDLRLDQLLIQPWRDTAGRYSINRRAEPVAE